MPKPAALRQIPNSLAFLLLFLASLVPFRQTLSTLVRFSLHGERYTHILLAPFIILCVFHLERKATLPSACYAPKRAIPLGPSTRANAISALATTRILLPHARLAPPRVEAL